jgi:hypothetical protein
MATRRSPKKKAVRASERAVRTETKAPARFVGRDPSPVLEKYTHKENPAGWTRPTVPDRHGPAAPAASAPKASSPSPAPASAAPSSAPAKPLISLERPFDLDEFAGLLGETTIRAEVPREDVAEALRRVADFMGFGIYVYQIRVAPANDELLNRFVVELQRVDFDPAKGTWVPFEEKGRSESPFGPSGGRR